MNLVVTALLGAMFGWLASLAIRGSSNLGVRLNVIAGVVGALAAVICINTLAASTQAAPLAGLLAAFGAVGGVIMLRWLSVPAPTPAARRTRR